MGRWVDHEFCEGRDWREWDEGEDEYEDGDGDDWGIWGESGIVVGWGNG
jgi:hypothetical protein